MFSKHPKEPPTDQTPFFSAPNGFFFLLPTLIKSAPKVPIWKILEEE